MKITIDEKVVFAVLDEIVGRWTATPKRFPYNLPRATVPQRLIPETLRRDKRALALFYFFVCIYMRGGIESAQAFRALLRIRGEHPELFDPLIAQALPKEEVQAVLKEFIGWDSESASISWVENSGLLMRYWKGNPLNLIKGLRDYDEALRRIRNKRTKSDLKTAGHDGFGFRGFQPKMVSMLIYFYDWEGWLEERFLYPAPADFHNFRIGLNQGGILVESNEAVPIVRQGEYLSKPWRDVLMRYLRMRKADPIEVADAIWLFSLTLCGESPLTRDAKKKTNGSGMFAEDDLPHLIEESFGSPRFRRALLRTCLRCPLVATCSLAIPAGPYYKKGLLVLKPRVRMEEFLGSFDPDPPARGQTVAHAPHPELFEPDGA